MHTVLPVLPEMIVSGRLVYDTSETPLSTLMHGRGDSEGRSGCSTKRIMREGLDGRDYCSIYIRSPSPQPPEWGTPRNRDGGPTVLRPTPHGSCSHRPPLEAPPSAGIHLPTPTGCHALPPAGTCSDTSRWCAPATMWTMPLRSAPFRGQSALLAGPAPVVGLPRQKTPLQPPVLTASLNTVGAPEAAARVRRSVIVLARTRGMSALCA
mmetsp:Transcript_10079/g.20254  ORF Transcript_10079/g.20254 Transcript_10079/m.20254 type:complete len:209 (-) Transcript_10079:150-776(-)